MLASLLSLLVLMQGAGGGLGQWDLVHMLIGVVIVVGVVAIVLIVCRACGVGIPPWVFQIFWICLLIFVAIIAIKFIASLW